MRITSNDLLTFAYCPFLQSSGGINKLTPSLSAREFLLKDSILAAEQFALSQDSYVTPKKLGSKWEERWWVYAAKKKISIPDTEKYSVKISRKITDYCNYDISGPGYENIGIDINTELSLGNCIVDVKVDLLKAPLFKDTHTLYMIDFINRDLSRVDMVGDIEILTKIYTLKDLKRPIVYINIDISESKRNLSTKACFFDLNDFEQIGRTLKFLADGIYKKVNYKCTWKCKDCKLCTSI